MNPTRAWLALVALSAASTFLASPVLSLPGMTGAWLALPILLLAWAKARLILREYLGLATAPGWSRGFSLVLGLYMLLMMGLAIMGNLAA
ncbi:MAG: cytochrome C oxidase subunit IV family protein [Nitratireductor sp.]|nr:cytochrome C oxidase subunit IV family protein [Nitratireductor sp.]MCB1455552.1 cytochrome C oxidase subunit IV family protein [Nitratireductor sp.]MCB1458402.1 cytochrome C oxidase subunit IV family protein [Nitratireductor sp.]